MRIRIEKYIHDTQLKLWGGSFHEGLARTSYCCPGYNTIAAYLEKKLPAKARKAVEAHMASCKECRFDLIDLRMLLKHLHED
ncbi:MAG: zf-HC2 domain-containing protein [Desulfovibrio sp.]|nr:zf-HC2 domain-containing protein [Desulfovibrio sp.]MCA1984933.1 zf-HC2 domain-containing protein [Desulfovibrio sp.]